MFCNHTSKGKNRTRGADTGAGGSIGFSDSESLSSSMNQGQFKADGA